MTKWITNGLLALLVFVMSLGGAPSRALAGASVEASVSLGSVVPRGFELIVDGGFEGRFEDLFRFDVRVFSAETAALVTWKALDRSAAGLLGGHVELWSLYEVRDEELVIEYGFSLRDAPRPPGPEIRGAWSQLLKVIDPMPDLGDFPPDYVGAGGAGGVTCEVTCNQLRASSANTDNAAQAALGHAISQFGGTLATALIGAGLTTLIVSGGAEVAGVTLTGVVLATNPIGWWLLGGGVLIGGALIIGGAVLSGGEDYQAGSAGACPGCGADPYAGWVIKEAADMCINPDCFVYGGDGDGDTYNDPSSEPPSNGQEPIGPDPALGETETAPQNTGGNPANADLGPGIDDEDEGDGGLLEGDCYDVTDCTPAPEGMLELCDSCFVNIWCYRPGEEPGSCWYECCGN